MIELVLIIIVTLLIVFIALSVVKKVFGFVLKIAVFCLVLILILGALIYGDLLRNNLIGDTTLVFANEDQILSGIVLTEGKLSKTLPSESFSSWNYSKLKQNEFEQIPNNSTLTILVVGNFEETKINFPERIDNYYQLSKLFKNDELHFYPKSTSLKLLEFIRN